MTPHHADAAERAAAAAAAGGFSLTVFVTWVVELTPILQAFALFAAAVSSLAAAWYYITKAK